ncbi:hypothetical protein TWF694_003010 [Orbilia ellipsospora]|uniref:Uncharacterized protein n=1 Tax=Orbilia ellipsospora TaxID=2528407 RepID=A0AAV9X1Q5_9PEZI
MPQTRRETASTGSPSAAITTAVGRNLSSNPTPTPTAKKTIITPPPPAPPMTPHSQKLIHMKATTPGTSEMAFSKRLAGRISLETPFRKGMVLQTPIRKRSREEEDEREVSPSEMLSRRKKMKLAGAGVGATPVRRSVGVGPKYGSAVETGIARNIEHEVPKTPNLPKEKDFAVVIFTAHGRGGRSTPVTAAAPVPAPVSEKRELSQVTGVVNDKENIKEEKGSGLTALLQAILTRLDKSNEDEEGRLETLEEAEEIVKEWDVEEVPGAMAAVQGSVEMKGLLFEAIFEAII